MGKLYPSATLGICTPHRACPESGLPSENTKCPSPQPWTRCSSPRIARRTQFARRHHTFSPLVDGRIATYIRVICSCCKSHCAAINARYIREPRIYSSTELFEVQSTAATSARLGGCAVHIRPRRGGILRGWMRCWIFHRPAV